MHYCKAFARKHAFSHFCLWVVNKWRHGIGGQGFCYDSTKGFVRKNVTVGVGGLKLFKIAWRHLWTTPFQPVWLSVWYSLSQDHTLMTSWCWGFGEFIIISINRYYCDILNEVYQNVSLHKGCHFTYRRSKWH